MVVQGIVVTADPALAHEEIMSIMDAEIEQWQKRGKALSRVELIVDGEEVIVKAVEKSPVRRIRRITGYLSSVDNFNDAKRAECGQRVSHITV